MTPPRLPLVKAQRSFLSGIRLSREQHGPKENLHTLISTDLEYLNAWSCRWLMKFNPNKTYIMIFSTRHLENNSIFDFNDISLSPVQICQ